MEGGQRNHVFDGGAHWRHLLNPVGWSVRGSDAALYQMTLTTCCCRVVTLWGIRWRCVLAANSQLLCQSFLSMFRSFTSVHRVYCGHVALGECKCSRVALWLCVFLNFAYFFSSFCLEICVLLFVLGVNSFLFHFSAYGHRETDWWLFFVMRPQSFSMECSTILQ